MKPEQIPHDPQRTPPGYLFRLALMAMLIGSLLMGLVTWWGVSEAQRQFERDAATTTELVARRLNSSETMLRGLAALYNAVEDVDQDQLTLYAQEILQRNPHIGFIDYLVRVVRDDLPTFEQSMHDLGYLTYRVRELRDGRWAPAALRPYYYPIVFIEPLEPRRAQFLGFDVYADPHMRQAIDAAIAGGGVNASTPFDLPDGRRGYALFKAIYTGLGIPAEEKARHEQASRMVSLLVYPDQLLRDSDRAAAGMEITLRYLGKAASDLAHIPASRHVKPLLAGFLPRLHSMRSLANGGQAFGIIIEKQLGAEVFNLGMLVSAALMSLLAVILLDVLRRYKVERQHNREALFQQQQQTAITLRSIGDAVITTDAGGRVEHMNSIAERLTGWPLAQARGRPLTDIFVIADEHTRGRLVDPVTECMREGRVVRLPESVIQRSKQDIELLIDASASPIRDRAGRIIGAVLVFHDVSKERQMEDRLAYQASHDSLTGLLDRSEFERQLEAALKSARESGRQHALCYMDLDQFKVVNDACGHAAGDELLVQLSALLLATVRETDILARLGGDEFAVLLMDCNLDLAVSKAGALRDVVKAFRFIWQGKSFEVGFGIGVVPITASSGSSTDVLRAADTACYTAKSKGRNQVFAYQLEDPELQKWRGEMRWATRIGEALQNQRFQLYYQVIKPLQMEEPKVFHCELLMRSAEEQGKLISPETFIPAAERFNLMTDIDRWVVNSALPRVAELARQAASRREKVLCGINLSAQSLSDETFYAYVTRLMDEHEVPAEAVCFEITETAAIANIEVALKFIRALRNRGCRFALDDFGTGVSSFAYLKKLPLDYVKIDGSFVRDMLNNPVDQAMVESINRVAHTLGIKTIAEYVEDESLLGKLRELGVDYAQGYAIARPAPLNEWPTGLASQ